MSGMCAWGGMVGWKGAMPKSSHNRRGWQGAKRGGKRSDLPVHLQQDRAGTPCHSGEGGGAVDRVSGGVHVDVDVLRLPHRVSAHGIEELVNTRRERG